MRLWSLHPGHLDRQGLVAAWREALLAQAVLLERTRGYRHHSQLLRFRALRDPVAAIGRYLLHLADEAERRGYRFDRGRIARSDESARLPLTEGQLMFEWLHLLSKLEGREPQWWSRQRTLRPLPHPLFELVPGPVEAWERGQPLEREPK